MAVTKIEIIDALKAAFPDSKPDVDILLEDMVGDGDHWNLFIASSKFAGISPLARHKMVNDALKDMLKSKLHAISIKTGEK